ncbi:MAG: hypothetical protein D8M58_21370 [Calditrichaeota bacterium]|nr:MAG: hypothetical protein DWQ03_00095 [Calditrichota bacterium]MBL1207964.1 hypothetical protein [Calditrichota bacterium]NOG47800.1 hypothetical protein [Calditrichota bacterium]
MIYSIDEGKVINYIPHAEEYDVWRKRLSDSEYEAIVDELNNRINSTEIQTSSWIPGSDWTGTVFEPIYTKACLNDVTQAGLCFGLIVWVVMMSRPETWAFGRYEKNGIPIRGLTYFQVDP